MQRRPGCGPDARAGLRACQPRAYKRTTLPGEQPVASPDLIGRDFTATAARRRELAAHMRRVFEVGRGAYGCRRVAAQLNRDGHPCSVGLVAGLMRELGLRACQPRAYKRTTVPGEQPASPDLISRTSPLRHPASVSSAISPTCAPGKGGCRWRP